MADDADEHLWRDPDGVVHLVASEAQLPGSVEAAVVRYLALSECDEALRRLDDLRELLDAWHDSALEEAAQSIDVALGPACEPLDVGTAPRMIDGAVASALEPLREEPAVGRRLNLLDEALRLVDEWLSYHLDPEKLVGHLVLTHGVGTPLASLDHDVLLREHQHLHR